MPASIQAKERIRAIFELRMDASTPSIQGFYGVEQASLVRNGVGDYTVTLDQILAPDTCIAIMGGAEGGQGVGGYFAQVIATASANAQIQCFAVDRAGNPSDNPFCYVRVIQGRIA